MKPSQVSALKQLALMGAIDEPVLVKSGEFAERIEASQQSASRLLICLGEQGYITREMGSRGQRVGITKKGLDALKKEHSHYTQIFSPSEELQITGTVVAGMGEGEYYVTREGYSKQFKSRLGFAPYPGTLNLELSKAGLEKLGALKTRRGIEISGFNDSGRTFGAVKSFKGKIGRVGCAIIIPKRTHHQNMIEIISKAHLRRTLGLKDGDKVKVRIMLDSE